MKLKSIAILLLVLYATMLFAVGLELKVPLGQEKDEEKNSETEDQDKNRNEAENSSTTFEVKDDASNADSKNGNANKANDPNDEAKAGNETIAGANEKPDDASEKKDAGIKASKEDAQALEANIQKLLEKEEISDDEKYTLLESGYSALLQYQAIDQASSIQRMQRIMAQIMLRLDSPEIAILHARECMKVKDANLKSVDMAYGFEIMARSYAAAGDKDKAQKYIDFAKRTAEQIRDDESKDEFMEVFEDGEWYGVKF
ncbi:MAG: hypothetical protein ACLFSQ_12735 [Candidatus Zixiibacteriota bacterium]